MCVVWPFLISSLSLSSVNCVCPGSNASLPIPSQEFGLFLQGVQRPFWKNQCIELFFAYTNLIARSGCAFSWLSSLSLDVSLMAAHFCSSCNQYPPMPGMAHRVCHSSKALTPGSAEIAHARVMSPSLIGDLATAIQGNQWGVVAN